MDNNFNANSNYFAVDYNSRVINLYYYGKNYQFNLDKGDIGDYWYAFKHRGVYKDVNFYQEGQYQHPSFSVYACEKDSNGNWQIITEQSEEIYFLGSVGEPKKYFR
jgi:hypothetical protein